MSIRNKNDIRVYSELPFQINLEGQHREYVFPAYKNGEPSMNFVDWSDIEFAHSRTNLFSAGFLIFEESEQEEIYNELRIRDWKDKVWFDKDIVDAIENPTLDKMQRIIDIKDSLVFERIRGKVVYYTNHGMDISQKVVNIVNARYRELNAGVIGSKIIIKPTDVESNVSNEEFEDLKKKYEEMQKMMAQMMDSKANNKTESINVDEPSTDDSKAVKRSGRRTSVKK